MTNKDSNKRKYAASTSSSPNQVNPTQKPHQEENPSSSSESESERISIEEDLEEYVKKKGHDDILKRLKSMQLGDIPKFRRGVGASPADDESSPTSHSQPNNPAASPNNSNRTLFHTLLSNATNGDKILAHKLDECVTLKGKDENDPDAALQVDLTPLLEGKSANQINIIKDMLDFKNTPARELLLHPVVQTFLEVKWRKIRKVFMVNFLVYALFLLSYSIYLANIFYRELHTRGGGRGAKIVLENGQQGKIFFPGNEEDEIDDDESEVTEVTTKKPKRNRNKQAKKAIYHLFETCSLSGSATINCCIEVILTLAIAILLAQELLQILALGPRRYFKEFENILELFVIGLVISGFAIQTDIIRLKWVSAFAICLAYLELIFLMGRYPFLGGSISLMFYNIVLHIFRSLLSFLMLIIGFAFGFFIIHHKKSTENFENPLKAIAKTLTMSLGEFDFNDLYDAHGKDSYSRSFTMLLMLGLAITGSLVLVNLIVAIIVSDIKELRKEAHLQEKINKAQSIIYSEGVFGYVCCFLCPSFRNYVRVANKVDVCGHKMCRCKAKKLDEEIVGGLKNIIIRRRLKEQLEALAGPSTAAATQHHQVDLRKDSALVRVLLGTLFSGSRRGDNFVGQNLVDMIIEEGTEIP